MAPAIFDHRRMERFMYPVDTPVAAAAFMCLVDDYMSYIRKDPAKDNPQWREEVEMASARDFISLLGDDERWSLAQLMAPEFRITRSAYKPPEFQPLRKILDWVAQERLQPKYITRVDRIPDYTEELFWQKIEKRVEFIAYGVQGEMRKTRERAEQVKDVMGNLRTFRSSSASAVDRGVSRM